MFKHKRFTFKELIEQQKIDREIIRSTNQSDQNLKTIEKEITLVSAKTNLTLVDLLQLRPHLTNIKTVDWTQYALGNFYNPEFIYSLQLLFDLLIVASPATGLAQTPSAQLFRRWLYHLRTVSVQGTGSDTFTVDYGQLAKAFVIKSPKVLFDRTGLHEQFVGMMYTNILRNYCPNFAYIYGSMYCTGPVSNPLFSEIWGFSLHNIVSKSSLHLIYENISPSIDLKSWLVEEMSSGTLTKPRFWSVVLQILLSLQLANSTQLDTRLQGFEHGDLNSGNVLLRNIPQVGYIWYPQVQRFLKVERVATLIDFEMAKVKVADQVYQVGDRQNLPIYPLGDVFILFVNIWLNIISGLSEQMKPEIQKFYLEWAEYLRPTLNWFIDGSLEELYNRFRLFQQNQDHQNGLQRYLPYKSDWQLNNYLDFILSQYRTDLIGLYVEKPDQSPLLTCDIRAGPTNCPAHLQYLSSLGFDWQQPWPRARSLLELADQVGLQIQKTGQTTLNFDSTLEAGHRQICLQLESELRRVPVHIFYCDISNYQSSLAIEQFRIYEQYLMQFTSLYTDLTQQVLVALYLFAVVYPAQVNLLATYYQVWLNLQNIYSQQKENYISSIERNKITIQSFPVDGDGKDQIYRRAQLLLENTCLPVLRGEVVTANQRQLLAGLAQKFTST